MPRMLAQLDFPRRPVAAPRRSRRLPGRRGGFCFKIPDYIFGSYIDEVLCMVKANGDRYWYSTNDLYSVYALTDATGAVVERYMYSPYGAVIVMDASGTPRAVNESLYGNPWTFTGRRLDGETGLMYFRNRIYSVDLGRFVSRDPIGYRGGMGLYGAYFVPLRTDPSGRLTVMKIAGSGFDENGEYPDPSVVGRTALLAAAREGKMNENISDHVYEFKLERDPPSVGVWQQIRVSLECIDVSGKQTAQNTISFDEFFPKGKLVDHHTFTFKDLAEAEGYHRAAANAVDAIPTSRSKTYRCSLNVHANAFEACKLLKDGRDFPTPATFTRYNLKQNAIHNISSFSGNTDNGVSAQYTKETRWWSKNVTIYWYNAAWGPPQLGADVESGSLDYKDMGEL